MKLLVISASYPPARSGESANAYHLCRRLGASGVDVHVLTTRGNVGCGDPGVTVHPVMQRWSWREALRLRRFIRECAPDAVLLMYLGGMYNYHSMITFVPTIVKRMRPHTTVVTRYESPFLGRTPRESLAARFARKAAVLVAGPANVSYQWGTLLRDSDHLIALCEEHRAVLVREHPAAAAAMTVIPPAPNVVLSPDAGGATRDRARRKLGVGGDECVLAFFGFVYPKKGIETLLEAFQILSRRRDNLRLLFIGGTVDIDPDASGRYWDEMHRLAADLGVAERTIWTGAFNPEADEASAYLRAADICVLPLLRGVQLNNSSFAAMAAHGIPLVTTRGATTDSAFSDGENVLMSHPGNATDLAARIEMVIDSPALQERLRGGVLELLRDCLSWDQALARTLALLQGSRAPVLAPRLLVPDPQGVGH